MEGKSNLFSDIKISVWNLL